MWDDIDGVLVIWILLLQLGVRFTWPAVDCHCDVPPRQHCPRSSLCFHAPGYLDCEQPRRFLGSNEPSTMPRLLGPVQWTALPNMPLLMPPLWYQSHSLPTPSSVHHRETRFPRLAHRSCSYPSLESRRHYQSHPDRAFHLEPCHVRTLVSTSHCR